jgi:tRNA pseudouridine55 synthase
MKAEGGRRMGKGARPCAPTPYPFPPKRIMEKIGALLVDKPAGITSHDVVARLRRALKQKRIGHTGTLDPFATGLMIVCLGRATRLAQFLTAETKVYEAIVRFGFSTDTQDRTGKPITPLISSDELTAADLCRLLSEFVGEQWQVPPMFSAKKVAGEALYRRARRGQTVERQAARIVVYRIEALEVGGSVLKTNPDGTRDAVLRLECSAGTYVRTLAHDLGKRVGCGAHLVELRRLGVGRFSVAEAARLDELLQRAERGEEITIISPAELVGSRPAIELEREQIWAVRMGQTQKSPLVESLETDTWVRLVDQDGSLISMAQVVESGGDRLLQPRILLID